MARQSYRNLLITLHGPLRAVSVTLHAAAQSGELCKYYRPSRQHDLTRERSWISICNPSITRGFVLPGETGITEPERTPSPSTCFTKFRF
ncbi:hypothetical protein J6590_041326 [Homalodisca vitripennis]|nr:hypothetical protein J6590_041326 [Homalodisca vitripennis]